METEGVLYYSVIAGWLTLLAWVSLFLTGRFFCWFNAENESTVGEDAIAALLSVVIAGVCLVIFKLLENHGWLGDLTAKRFSRIACIGIILFAYQLEGLREILSFYALWLPLGAILLIGTYFTFEFLGYSFPLMEWV